MEDRLAWFDRACPELVEGLTMSGKRHTPARPELVGGSSVWLRISETGLYVECPGCGSTGSP